MVVYASIWINHCCLLLIVDHCYATDDDERTAPSRVPGKRCTDVLVDQCSGIAH